MLVLATPDVLEPGQPSQTIYAADPHPLLTPIAADGVTDDSATLAAQLAYLHSIGGGRLDTRMPGQVIKCNSGLTVPAGVQIYSNEYTLFDFSGVGSGTAITVNDNDFTPLVGVRIEGPNSTASSSDTSTGISVTGVGLRFYNLRVKYFGKGIDLAHSNTFIHAYLAGDIGYCGTCIYANSTGRSLSQFGERIVFHNYTIYNSDLGLNADTGELKFKACSFDYNNRQALLSGLASFDGCHFESGGGSGTGYNYMIQLTGNPVIGFTDTAFILNGGQTPSLAFVCDPNNGPFNYNQGVVRIDNLSWAYVGDTGQTWRSDHLLSWPASTTTTSYTTPWPLRWCTVSADFAVTDNYTQPNTDRVQFTAMGGSAGTFTLTTPSNANQRWIRIHF